MTLEHLTIAGADLPPLGYFSDCPFYIEMFRDVANRGKEVGWVKPDTGGLWTSPIYPNNCDCEPEEEWNYCTGKSRTPWECWCANNTFRGPINFKWLNKIELWGNATVLRIDKYNDLKDAIAVYADKRDAGHPDLFANKYLDFERLALEFDAIWLTERGQSVTHFSPGYEFTNPDLYGWDCETVLILKASAIYSAEVIEERKIND